MAACFCLTVYMCLVANARVPGSYGDLILLYSSYRTTFLGQIFDILVSKMRRQGKQCASIYNNATYFHCFPALFNGTLCVLAWATSNLLYCVLERVNAFYNSLRKSFNYFPYLEAPFGSGSIKL